MSAARRAVRAADGIAVLRAPVLESDQGGDGVALENRRWPKDDGREIPIDEGRGSGRGALPASAAERALRVSRDVAVASPLGRPVRSARLAVNAARAPG